MVAPWRRRDMAKQMVKQGKVSIRLACDTYGIAKRVTVIKPVSLLIGC
ncbi:MAG: hypothetical protein H6938_03395 [Burkholderiales bacterium]|nr:hypothetical protein [Burkholderiales bacterium]